MPDCVTPPFRVSLLCSYAYVTNVGANDMYDGLTTAANMFVEYTIARFEEVKQLHIILLVCSLVLILAFVWKVFRCVIGGRGEGSMALILALCMKLSSRLQSCIVVLTVHNIALQPPCDEPLVTTLPPPKKNTRSPSIRAGRTCASCTLSPRPLLV